MNKFQQSRYFVDQTKTTTNNSQIRFSAIGGGYKANVKAQDRSQNNNSGTQYTEQKNLGTGYTHSIPNKTPKGKNTRLIVTNATWSPVSVAISGWFKTN